MKKWDITKTVNVFCIGAMAAGVAMFAATLFMR